MRLSQLAAAVPGVQVRAGGDHEVWRVVDDSRQARPGDLFVAVRGRHRDGHSFAPEVAARGVAVALERPVPLPAGTPWLQLREARQDLGELAAALNGRPARRLLTVGVTGTVGKSTTTHMIAHVLESAGLRAGYLSTVAHGVGGRGHANDSGLTTMGAPEVQSWLARMEAEGAVVAVVECSSHALDQGRVAGCEFDVAAFTNVGRDHLDYHGSWEAYLAAKARLIELCARGWAKGIAKTAVLNRDDMSYPYLAPRPIERRLTYGLGPADVQAVRLESGDDGSRFDLRTPWGEAEVSLRMPGRFNVANALCAAAAALALGVEVEQVAAGLSDFPGLRGRLEPVRLGQPFDVYIDFAHSSIGLETVLAELRGRLGRDGRLLAVFGATARADHDPAGMGRAAARWADFFVITTDDPLAEDPAELARQVEAGVEGRQRARDYEVVLDRRAAIRRAVELARPGDIVLLAGKGHERTLLLAHGPVPWDERVEAESAIREFWPQAVDEAAER
ncbi:MAG TPA: UDP-N-acetylmuramoyl-L-alanyl-D-glutamate--2,6-diaminopimelate ligase [Candidatus Dormibacteraeota bacterium]|nr:UDP-N-acetylmuramoyl-L-alanyl-D-glutamate--2,6-diaminopimelate ligase [Candidatus Dormibacteraeota bacterium]